MDSRRFDDLARALAGRRSRRLIMKALVGTTAGVALMGYASRQVVAHATLTGCRPSESSFPTPRPALQAPFRAATDEDQQGACQALPMAIGVTPVVTAGYADVDRSDTHTDHYFNAYYAVSFGAENKAFPILAAADGTLVRHDENEGIGLYIRHDASWQTVYLHLAECGLVAGADGQTPIKNGEWVPVSQGQPIGFAGPTPTGSYYMRFELRGGDTRAFMSCPSEPGPDCQEPCCTPCCATGTCNWTYPLPEFGVPAPESEPAPSTCARPATCPSLTGEDELVQLRSCCSVRARASASPPVSFESEAPPISDGGESVVSLPDTGTGHPAPGSRNRWLAPVAVVSAGAALALDRLRRLKVEL